MQSAAAVAGSTLDSGASVCSNLCTQKWMLILRRWPDRVFAWRYTHLLLFAAIPAVGVGLRVAAEALEGSGFTLMQITLSLAIPVVCVLVLIFVLWSVLMRAYDLSHVPLLLVSLIPWPPPCSSPRFPAGRPLSTRRASRTSRLWWWSSR